MADRVIVNRHGGVADVRLNRPDKLNGLDSAMFLQLAQAGRDLADDGSLRAVVLSGEGRSFCAGLDFASFLGENDAPDLLSRREGEVATMAQAAAYVWHTLPVPVIAALHGHVYGGGLQIALASDIRFAAPDAKLSVMEIKWGLIPDMTGPQTLRRLLPLDVIKELVFTGRIVSGEEAKTLGLVTHLSEKPHEDAMALAEEIALKSPHAIRSGKRILNESGDLDADKVLRLEVGLQKKLLGSPNQMEAVSANMEKRTPNFQDVD